MHISSRLRRSAAFLLFAIAPKLALAVDTHVWEQSDQAEFARGTTKNLSIRSDGRITLAPEFRELDSTGTPYLWAVAQDSKGSIYYGGGAPTGATTKVFVLPPHGKPKTLVELSGLEVHALAVDRQDRVYAAVLPDAKIYRIGADGKSQLFFDPKCKYVWAMTFDSAGNLFLATGDSGLIYKVAADGKGEKFFDTRETHARSMVIDSAGNLIVGTEPGGLIMRVTPDGKGFVLYQANKREVTAVAERNGIIYAAAIGSKPSSVSVSGPAPVLPSAQTAVAATGAPRTGTPPPSLGPAVGTIAAAVSGGSEVYRLDKEGVADRIWNSPSELIYALSFDSSGKPLLGSGNKGVIYRIDSDQLSTELLTAAPTQVTAFLQGKGGIVYAATGNVGNLYAIGPSLAKSGTLESEVLDANGFAYWGKAHLTSKIEGGSSMLETRSGNLNNPENGWSSWSKVPLSELGGAITSPPARFLQYRLTLDCSDAIGRESLPEVSAVSIPYLPKNLAPKVQAVEIAPFNYREAPSTSSLERSVSTAGSPMTLSLPAVGQRKSATSLLSLESGGGATLQYSKGFVTVRWSAVDPNGDSLLFRVELREKNASQWQLLKDKLQDRFYAFDSTAWPDAQYVVRVSASDSPSNTPSAALTSSMESDPFTVDNTAPEILDLTRAADGNGSRVTFTAKDARSWIDRAEYSVNGTDWTLLEPLGKVTDSQVLKYDFTAPSGGAIAVRAFDENDNVIVKQVPGR
jgi:sugar lactone lactonase YvrE